MRDTHAQILNTAKLAVVRRICGSPLRWRAILLSWPCLHGRLWGAHKRPGLCRSRRPGQFVCERLRCGLEGALRIHVGRVPEDPFLVAGVIDRLNLRPYFIRSIGVTPGEIL